MVAARLCNGLARQQFPKPRRAMEAAGAITPTEVETKLRSALMIVDGAARGKRTDMHQVLPPMAALLSLSWRLEGLLRSATARCSVQELNNLVNLGTKLHNGEATGMRMVRWSCERCFAGSSTRRASTALHHHAALVLRAPPFPLPLTLPGLRLSSLFKNTGTEGEKLVATLKSVAALVLALSHNGTPKSLADTIRICGKGAPRRLVVRKGHYGHEEARLQLLAVRSLLRSLLRYVRCYAGSTAPTPCLLLLLLHRHSCPSPLGTLQRGPRRRCAQDDRGLRPPSHHHHHRHPPPDNHRRHH